MREHGNDGAPVALAISLTPFAALLQSIPFVAGARRWIGGKCFFSCSQLPAWRSNCKVGRGLNSADA
jgi:hypothetical protein